MQKEKQLVPKLRFTEFEGGWVQEKLGKRCLKIGDGLHGTPQYVDNSDIYFINGNNINSGKIEVYENTKQVSLKDYTSNKKDVNLNTLLISLNGTIGNIGWYNNEPVMLGKSVGYLTFYEKPLFEFHYLNTPKAQRFFISQLTGSTIKNLSLKTLRDTSVFFPQQEEQQKIANFLTSIDTQTQNLEKKKILLEQYKKGLLQKIFKQELRFKDDDGNAFPKWRKKKLGDLTYKVGKKNKENIQYPIYSINNQEGFRPQSEQFDGLDSNDRGYDISLYKIVYKETFAYNPARINVGSIGYSYDLKEVIVSSLYVCFKTNEELEDLFLLAYLDTDRFNKDILRYQEGGVRQYLFYENFSQIKIPLPSNEEQIKIANFLSAIDKNIALVNTKIEHTKAYKKGLLQQMFV